MSTELSIQGMHCDGCVRRVRKILEKTGAPIADVSVGSAKIDGSAEDAQKAVSALVEAGYAAVVSSAVRST